MGLLDAAHALDEARRRDLIRCGLESAHASARRTAIDHLCALDGPGIASLRARARYQRGGAQAAAAPSGAHDPTPVQVLMSATASRERRPART
jgi:hypothetical protein